MWLVETVRYQEEMREEEEEGEGIKGKGEEKLDLVNPLDVSKDPCEPRLQQTLLEITNKSVNLLWLSSGYFYRILTKINC